MTNVSTMIKDSCDPIMLEISTVLSLVKRSGENYVEYLCDVKDSGSSIRTTISMAIDCNLHLTICDGRIEI